MLQLLLTLPTLKIKPTKKCISSNQIIKQKTQQYSLITE